MHIVFFTHPDFIGHKSMPRYAKMLAEGMKERGYSVEIWSPKPFFYNLSLSKSFKKWLGYLDQYILFPLKVRKQVISTSKDTLFVFTDHALGPWLPLVADRPHIVHCHDFLAQQSALDLIPENPTSKTGKQYQAYIKRGYSQGKNFISVSKKTQHDLHQFVDPTTVESEVVYNGLNQNYAVKEALKARITLKNKTGIDLKNGYLLHIGGNQWYKNRLGVVEIYDAWRKTTTTPLPLLLIGETVDDKLSERIKLSEFKTEIYSFSNIEDDLIIDAYSGASMFLFPSLAEGFGWPIAEAMACGCPVITTNEAPMTEVAGKAGYLIPKMPNNSNQIENWANNSAETVEKIISLSAKERHDLVQTGIDNAKRFDSDAALDQIEKIYKSVLKKSIQS